MKVIPRACSAETVVRRFSWKKVFLKIFKNSQENTCAREDSGTGVFLWISRNFQEDFFLKNTTSGCFHKIFTSIETESFT